jgi:hypothetical protein
MNPKKLIAYAGAIVLCALLIGMGGPPRCAGSESPLSDREQGHTDYYLVGRWHEVNISDTGLLEIGPLLYEITLSDDGGLDFVDPDNESDSCAAMRAYTTQIGAKKYLNVVTDMSDCDETTRSEFEQIPCRIFIVQYSTFLPVALAAAVSAEIKAERERENWRKSHPGELEPIIIPEPGDEDPAITRALLAQAERYSGNLLFYSEMDNYFVEEAIESGAIEGTNDCEECVGACIQLNESDLRDFVQKNDKDLFWDWQWLIRQQ